MDGSVVHQQLSEAMAFEWAKLDRTFEGCGTGQFSQQFVLKVKLSQVFVEICFVRAHVLAEAALDEERALHAGGRGLDEVIERRGDVALRSVGGRSRGIPCQGNRRRK